MWNHVVYLPLSFVHWKVWQTVSCSSPTFSCLPNAPACFSRVHVCQAVCLFSLFFSGSFSAVSDSLRQLRRKVSMLTKFSATALFTSSNNFLFLLLLPPYKRAENTVMISRTSFASSSSNLTFSSPLLIIITSTSLAAQIANTSEQHHDLHTQDCPIPWPHKSRTQVLRQSEGVYLYALIPIFSLVLQGWDSEVLSILSCSSSCHFPGPE